MFKNTNIQPNRLPEDRNFGSYSPQLIFSAVVAVTPLTHR